MADAMRRASALLAGDPVVVAVEVAVVPLGAVVDAVAALEVRDVSAAIDGAAPAHTVRELVVEVGAVVVDAGRVGLCGRDGGGRAAQDEAGGCNDGADALRERADSTGQRNTWRWRVRQ